MSTRFHWQVPLGLKSGPKIHFDHLEGVDEVDPTMARKINMCNFNFNFNFNLEFPTEVLVCISVASVLRSLE